VHDVQFKIRHQRGHYIDISFEGCIGYHPDGSFKQTYCVFKDITDQKLAEDSLRSSQIFNETLLNTSPDIIYIFDILEQKNIYSNDGISRVLGYSSDEITDMGDSFLSTLFHPDDLTFYLNNTLPRYQTAEDGELIEIFHEHIDEITGVLLDLTMPHKDGAEVFREIRKLNPDVKVILSSGYNEQDATQQFVGKGLAGFIQKPYTSAELTKKVKEIMNDNESSRA